MWRRWHASAARPPRRGGGRAAAAARAPGPTDLAAADVVVLATGARPYRPPWADGDGAPAVLDAWTAIANPAAVAGPVLVADWGGGWDGLDAAEVLAAHGLEVTLACAAPCPGETLHQYQRNLYLARLDERGIAIRHHLELTRRRPAVLRSRAASPGSRPSGRSSTRTAASRRTTCGRRSRGPAGTRPRGRRARPALGRGSDARGNRCGRAAPGGRHDVLSGSPERSSVACASSRISSARSWFAL